MECKCVTIKFHSAWRVFFIKSEETLKLAKFQDTVFQSDIPNIVLLLL